MLDDQALSRITGTIIRGVERIATKDVLAFLGLEQRETISGGAPRIGSDEAIRGFKGLTRGAD